MPLTPFPWCSEFKAGYYTIGDQIAAYGGPDWSSSDAVGGADDKFGPKLKRGAVKGSPVVPKSAKLIKEDNEYALYAVTVLRGHYTAGYFTDGVFTPGTFSVDICCFFPFDGNDRR